VSASIIGMDQDGAPPSRDEIEERWVALIEGRVTRDEVSHWASRHFNDGGVDEPCIKRGLGQLFSFKLVSEEGNPLGLAEPPPVGEYLWTITELADRLNEWKSWCVKIDADPSRLPHVEHEVRLRLSDGSEVDGGHYVTFRRRSVGETINLPDGPDGQAREGVGFIWQVAEVEEQGNDHFRIVLEFVRAHPRQKLEWPQPLP
jgi:hypothetical protein